MPRLLLFGAAGAIGTAIARHASAMGFEVIGTSRKSSLSEHAKTIIAYSGLEAAKEAGLLAAHGPYDAVCWAHGVNAADSVYDFDAAKHLDVYQANCIFILTSLNQLLEHKLLEKPARMVVISSIWQNIARQNKLSYTMSKAALNGLVHSAAVDLGADGHLINAVMPGVLDTPMTHANLSATQFEKVENATLFKRLANVDDIASLSCYLFSKQNQAITGQSIAVDLGFSNARFI